MSTYVGKPILRYDGIGHVAGRTTYVDDVHLPGMLYIKVLRSPVHRGIIRNLDVSSVENMAGVAGVITAKDIPGTNAYGLVPDQPVFPPEHIRYKGERLAAVAAVDEDTAMEAVEKIGLDIEEQTPVFDPVEAMKPDAPRVTPDGNLAEFNSGKSRIMRFGDVEKAFSEAEHIIEGTYRQAPNDHSSMEPHASVAYIDATERLAIHTCSQDLYFHLGMLSAIFNLPMNKIRYIGGTIGGGFGGKNDIHCDHVTGLMALKIRRPVKYRLTRREDLLYSTKRGPYILEFKDGVDKEGRLIARKIRVIHDAGGYAGMGPYIVEKMLVFVAGPYWIPNVWFDGYSVFTNKPPCSSMRAFGTVNTAVACETQMNRIAEAIGMNPWEFRFINAWRDGDTGPTQWKVVSAGLIEAMKKAAELAGVDLPGHLKAMSSQRR